MPQQLLNNNSLLTYKKHRQLPVFFRHLLFVFRDRLSVADSVSFRALCHSAAQAGPAQMYPWMSFRGLTPNFVIPWLDHGIQVKYELFIIITWAPWSSHGVTMVYNGALRPTVIAGSVTDGAIIQTESGRV